LREHESLQTARFLPRHRAQPRPIIPEGILDALAEIFHELGGKETLSAVGVAVAAFLNAERDNIFSLRTSPGKISL
jgi:hypothetical protein